MCGNELNGEMVIVQVDNIWCNTLLYILWKDIRFTSERHLLRSRVIYAILSEGKNNINSDNNNLTTIARGHRVVGLPCSR